uniref:uncharacterized protein n=1 Tax=Pristiophorus japonicus TaxID=55135 RepID=UPI00398F58C0
MAPRRRRQRDRDQKMSDTARKRKISKNQVEWRQTGGGLADLHPLTDLKARAAALVGIYNRSTYRAADPIAAPPPQAQQEAPAAPPMPLRVVLTTEENTTEEEEEEEEDELDTSSVVPAASSSSMDEAAGPSGLQQAAPSHPVPLPAPRRLSRRGRHVLRRAHVNEDVMSLSRASVDFGRELVQAIGVLTGNFATLSATISEGLEQIAVAMDQMPDAIEALRQAIVSRYGSAPQGAVPPTSATDATQEEELPSNSQDVSSQRRLGPVTRGLSGKVRVTTRRGQVRGGKRGRR